MRERQIRVRSYAKVNLGLEVLRRRTDGYHDIVTILHEIDLSDSFVWTDTGKPFKYMSPPEIDPASDLVRRALDLAPDRDGWSGSLRLEKCIPIAAGLGGGSSNAALALRLAFPGPLDGEISERAARIGSDVPFFLSGGTALATGTGTTLTELPTQQLWFVLVVPNVAIADKTASMYGRLTASDFSDGSATFAIAEEIRKGAYFPRSSPSTFLQHAPCNSAVQRAFQTVLHALGQCTLSGAGPAIFGVFHTREDAYAAREILPNDLGCILVTGSEIRRNNRSVNQLALALRGTIHG